MLFPLVSPSWVLVVFSRLAERKLNANVRAPVSLGELGEFRVCKLTETIVVYRATVRDVSNKGKKYIKGSCPCHSCHLSKMSSYKQSFCLFVCLIPTAPVI